MRTQLFRNLALAFAVALPSLVGGCNEASTNNPAPASPTNAPAASASPESDVATPATPGAMAEATQPEVPFGVERPLPPNLTPSSSLHEVIKLAQAGVDDEVLTTF